MSALDDRIARSALWAAYGDALGFISELTSPSGLKRRIGRQVVETTVPWRRRVGGRGGPTADLPAGCLSDDTQLRLATSRAIRGDGEFDSEAFSKVELPVWTGYALGGGKGTMTAASALRKDRVTWATNFFSERGVDYLNAGGNGAAMRIQPHVWSHGETLDFARLSAQVLANAISTHGHPRGFVGALFHALCLHETMKRGASLTPKQLANVAASLVEFQPTLRDPMFSELWRTEWETRADRPLSSAIEETATEMVRAIESCGDLQRRHPDESYVEMIDRLDLRNPAQRGSGSGTTVAGGIGAWLFSGRPEEAVRVCANVLGSDTDTIATMVGALLGINAEKDPEGQIADRDYILDEAGRMGAIASGGAAPTFRYPDLLEWSAPRNAADCLLQVDGKPELAGLGPVSDWDEEGVEKRPFVWRWVTLWFGQRILAKHRSRPNALPVSQRVQPVQEYLSPTLAAPSLAVDVDPPPKSGNNHRDLHALTGEVIASGFDPRVLGEALLEVSDRDAGIEESIAFASIIAKARRTRRDRSR